MPSITLMALIHVAVIGRALGWPMPDIGRLVPLLVGGMTLVLGNVMPRARPNWWFGIRTPWTLSSDTVWTRTHRMGGYLMTAAGIITVLSVVLPPRASFVVLMVVDRGGVAGCRGLLLLRLARGTTVIRSSMAAAGLALLLAAPAGAQAAAPYTFRMLVGRDTLSSEVVQRTATRLDVDMIDKSTGARWQYGMTLAPDGRVPAMTNAYYRLAKGDTVPFQRAELTFGPDSVTVTISGNVSRVEHLATRPGVVPYINPSFAMIEQVVRRARAMGGAVDTVPLFMVAGG